MDNLFNNAQKRQQRARKTTVDEHFLHAFCMEVLQEDVQQFADMALQPQHLQTWPVADGAHEALAYDTSNTPVNDDGKKALISFLHLHWNNDIPGVLRQYYNALAPGETLLGCMLGAGSMAETKQQLMQVETMLHEGAGRRFAPLLDIKTLGSLLQRAGFTSPIVKEEIFTLRYNSVLTALKDLRAAGEQSCLLDTTYFSRALYHHIQAPIPAYEDHMHVLFWAAKR